MTKEELTKVLRLHKLWLDGKTDGKRADLGYANLRDADLTDINLRGADLRGACLRDADLTDINLRGADLRGACLRDADLRDANLTDVNLRGADLKYVNLTDINLRGVDLRDADLWGADLWGADLRDADLWGADLRGAILSGTKGLVSFGPVGEMRRIGYVYKHDGGVKVQLGCFNGTAAEAVNAVSKKYGPDSSYLQFLNAAINELLWSLDQ